MSDEFDNAAHPAAMPRDPKNAEASKGRIRMPAARIVSRLYGSANRSVRAKLLACLVRPLSPLGLVAVAAGAFAGVLRFGSNGVGVAIEDVASYSGEQVLELASFVEQVSPQALQQFALVLSDSTAGMTAFSAAAVVLLLRAVQTHSLPMAHSKR